MHVEYIGIQWDAHPNTWSGYNGYSQYSTIHFKYNEIPRSVAYRNTVRRTRRYMYGIPWIHWIHSNAAWIPWDTGMRNTSKYSETHFQIHVRDTVDTLQYPLCALRYVPSTWCGLHHNQRDEDTPDTTQILRIRFKYARYSLKCVSFSSSNNTHQGGWQRLSWVLGAHLPSHPSGSCACQLW